MEIQTVEERKRFYFDASLEHRSAYERSLGNEEATSMLDMNQTEATVLLSDFVDLWYV